MERKTVKTWEATKTRNLLRHKSGKYYARMYRDGKEVWTPLHTDVYSVAKAKLPEALRDVQKAEKPRSKKDRWHVANAIEAHQKNLAENVTIKPTTRHYWDQIITSLKKTWPELAETDVRRITAADCRSWASRLAQTASSTRYNNTIAALRHIFECAVAEGFIFRNPAADLKRVRVSKKSLTLPTREQFTHLLKTVGGAGAWCSRDCADLLAGLAYTGLRKGEAAELEWRDVDFGVGEITVRITKNSEERKIPMIPDAEALFRRMRSDRKDEPESEKVFKVKESQKAIDSAVKKVGMARITHHDLRHLFATRCIESGVDIPTVSRWLGHKDGGALAMKTYGHLRREHSIAAAKKVQF